jgi:hypothetical protein
MLEYMRAIDKYLVSGIFLAGINIPVSLLTRLSKDRSDGAGAN